MANIAVFNSHTLWPLHYETELEIIQDLENSDNEIYHVVCNGNIRICDLNISNEPLRCLHCIEKRKKGKVVTVIRGLSERANDLPALLSQLKSQCGAGGTIQDDCVEIQGEHVERIRAALSEIGYRVKG